LAIKKVLITAGPTWVAIDAVRVISNSATGKTGILLANALKRRGCKVTLVLGPGPQPCVAKGIAVIRFCFFDELVGIISRQLRKGRFDAVVHSAAVADYRPARVARHKIRSGISHVRLELVPTPKILDMMKKIRPSLYVAAFKFEPGAAKAGMLAAARKLLKRAHADLVVANTVRSRRYAAYLVDSAKAEGPLGSKEALVKALTRRMVS